MTNKTLHMLEDIVVFVQVLAFLFIDIWLFIVLLRLYGVKPDHKNRRLPNAPPRPNRPPPPVAAVKTVKETNNETH